MITTSCLRTQTSGCPDMSSLVMFTFPKFSCSRIASRVPTTGKSRGANEMGMVQRAHSVADLSDSHLTPTASTYWQHSSLPY